MTAMTGPGLHPVSRAVSTMHDQVGEVTDSPLWSMGPAEAGDTLRELPGGKVAFHRRT
jgi:hypothetical protein